MSTVRKLNSLRFSPLLITCRHYKNYKKENLNKDLKEAPWNQVLKPHDAEIAYNTFESILIKVFDKHAPVTQKKVCGLFFCFFFICTLLIQHKYIIQRYHWVQYQCHTQWPLHISRNSS